MRKNRPDAILADDLGLARIARKTTLNGKIVSFLGLFLPGRLATAGKISPLAGKNRFYRFRTARTWKIGGLILPL